MNIFDKRPLALILCVSVGSFVIFSFFEDIGLRVLLISLLSISLIFTFIKPLQRFIKKTLTRVLLTVSILSMLLSFIYFDLWFKAYERYEDEVVIEGIVESFDNSSYNTKVILKTDNIDNSPLSRYKLLVFLNKNIHYGFSVGSRIRLTGNIECVSSTGNFDSYSYYTARGISGTVTGPSKFEILDNGSPPFSYKLYDYRQSISRRLIQNSKSTEVGGLLSALLLGDKEYLPTGTKLDFTRTGIAHILALSGSHLVILSIGLLKLLMRFGVKKKPATVLMIAFTVFYMAITGFSPSVTRASIMLIISSTLYLLSRTKDSMTSLCASVVIILVITPYSVFDISLWLSAFATLGIVVMCEFQFGKAMKSRFLNWVLISLLASLFAISATFTMTTLKFDGTSLVAALTTLVFEILIEIFLYVGLILLFFGSLLPIYKILVPIGNIIIKLVSYVSDIKPLYIATNFPVIIILSILFGILFFGFMIVKIKRKKTALTLIFSFLISIFTLSAILTYDRQNQSNITYFNYTDEHFILTDEGEISVIDVTLPDRSTAYSLYNDVALSNITHIDKYIVTNYSFSLCEALLTLSETVLIDEVYIPAPQSKTEERLFFDVVELCKKTGQKLDFYESEEQISVGETTFSSLYNNKLGARKRNLFTVLKDNKLYTYVGVDLLSGKQKNMAYEVIGASHAIIFGHHESAGSDYELTSEFENAEIILFSSDRIVCTEEIMEYYMQKRCYISPSKVELYVK